jgi:hypothetical protein
MPALHCRVGRDMEMDGSDEEREAEEYQFSLA